MRPTSSNSKLISVSATTDHLFFDLYIVCLLLLFLAEEQAYAAYLGAVESKKFQKYRLFPATIYSSTLLALVQQFNKTLADHMELVGVDPDFAELWFCRL